MTLSIRGFGFAFLTGLLASSAMGASCNPQSVFACSTDEDCEGQGEGGICEPNNMCSFPDDECPGGRRWHTRAPSAMAGECFGDDAGGETEGDDESTGGATAEPTTTAMTDTSSTTPDDETSASGADDEESSTGAALPSCDEQYGEAPDYLLCEEKPESCAFNATIANTISCNEVCSMFGGTCIEAHLNEEDLCVATDPATCDQSDFNDGICVCTRG